MLPNLPQSNSRNERVRYSESSSERLRLFSSGSANANLSNLFFSQDGASAGLALSTSSLLHHIGHVVVIRAKEQVVGVHASRVVAARTIVKNLKAVRYGAEAEHPGKTVCPLFVLVVVLRENAVAGFVYAPCPQPARFGLVDLLPEANLWRPDLVGVAACLAAILAVLGILEKAGVANERGSAVDANSADFDRFNFGHGRSPDKSGIMGNAGGTHTFGVLSL